MRKKDVKPDPEAPKDADQQAPGYTKQQFLGAEKYAAKKDVLNALLEDEMTYTADEVYTMVNKFMKQEAR